MHTSAYMRLEFHFLLFDHGGLGFPRRKKRGMAVQTETGEPGKPEIVYEYQTPSRDMDLCQKLLRDSPDVII